MDSHMRLGIDVGGTNTDSVIIGSDGGVIASAKTPTTSDPMEGIFAVLVEVTRGINLDWVNQAMLGTTHPANAIIERTGLETVAALRLAAPSSTAVPPGAAWPQDMLDTVLGETAIVRGGFEFDGSEISPLDEDAVRRFAYSIAETHGAVSITGTFSPAFNDHEVRAAEIIRNELGDDIGITCSHEVGALGLLERENAAIMNSSLFGVARRVIEGFHGALVRAGLNVESFMTQNDGTLMTSEVALRLPILTVGSGPTNSMRGACALASVSDALVIDVGGTSADIGMLVGGFPRSSATAVELGGIRTNFRMPDLISVGLGGGTVVRNSKSGIEIGPDSIGFRVGTEALCVGGETLTLTDLSVLAGRLTGFGDAAAINGVDQHTLDKGLAWIDENMSVICDRMKASRGTLPLVAVGGGSHLVPDQLSGIGEVIRPEHFAVANAYGAAIAEASGSVDRVYRYEELGRESALQDAQQIARDHAIQAGADPEAIRITALSEIPMSYLPGQACRVQAKAVGPLLESR